MMQVKCEKCDAVNYSASSIVKCECGGMCFSVDTALGSVNKNKNIVRKKTNGGK